MLNIFLKPKKNHLEFSYTENLFLSIYLIIYSIIIYHVINIKSFNSYNTSIGRNYYNIHFTNKKTKAQRS